MEAVLASLFSINMPRFYWGEATKFFAYIINRTPSRVIGFQTPQQKLQLLLSIPYLPNLEPRVFGCTIYVHILKILWNKLNPYVKRCVFISYSDFEKGHVCYDPKTQKVSVILDASFCELEPYYLGEVSRTYLIGESSIEENLLLESGEEEFIELKNYLKIW